MKQKPSFQCYQQDILGSLDVQMMTAEEFGCYMLILLNLYNNDGVVPSDKNSLKMLCRGVEISEKVYAKFYEKNGELRNHRADEELKKRKKFSKTQAENAKKRWGNGSAKVVPNECDGINSASIRQCSSSSFSSSNLNTREREETRARNDFTSHEASDELQKLMDFVRTRVNLIQLKNEREWADVVFRCEREKIDFEQFFEFIESKRDPTKSGSVTPKMMLSDNWIASFKNPTPKTEQSNGNTRQPTEQVRYKSAAERNSEQVVRNFKALAKNRNANNAGNGSGNEERLLGSGETFDFEILGTSEPEHPF